MKFPGYVKATFFMVVMTLVHLPMFAMSAYTWSLGSSSSASVVEMYVVRVIGTGMFVASTVCFVFAIRAVYCEYKEDWRKR